MQKVNATEGNLEKNGPLLFEYATVHGIVDQNSLPCDFCDDVIYYGEEFKVYKDSEGRRHFKCKRHLNGGQTVQKVDATKDNLDRLKALQELASEILDKVNQLNEAAKDAGAEGLILTYEQDTYQTDRSLVPYIVATVSLELP